MQVNRQIPKTVLAPIIESLHARDIIPLEVVVGSRALVLRLSDENKTVKCLCEIGFKRQGTHYTHPDGRILYIGPSRSGESSFMLQQLSNAKK